MRHVEESDEQNAVFDMRTANNKKQTVLSSKDNADNDDDNNDDTVEMNTIKKKSLSNREQFAFRQRSTTRTAVKFTLITVAMFLLVVTYVSIFEYQVSNHQNNYTRLLNPYRTLEEQNDDDQNKNEEKDYETKNCEDIYVYTSPDDMEDRCLFAKSCNYNDGFPFSSYVFCSSYFTTFQILCFCSVPLFILLVTLFRMLGSTAEDYFSPSLEMFSKKLGLPPRFAGVTLLALGNGAADVSAIMSAVTSNPTTGYEMALGSLTGGGMFIGTVVAGIVIVTAGSVTCRGALVRDVSALSLTVIIVFYQFSKGKIGEKATMLFFSLYFIFVGIVLVADVYHRKVVLPRIQARLDHNERMRQLEEERKAKEITGEAVEEMMGVNRTKSKLSPENAVGTILTALSNYESLDEDSVHPPNDSEGWGVVPDEDGMEKMMTLHGKHGIITSNHHGTANNSMEAFGRNGESPYRAMEDNIESLEIGDGYDDVGVFNKATWRKALNENREEFVEHWKEYVSDVFQNADVHGIDKFLLAIEFPFTVARQMSIPVPTDGYYCRPIIALSCAISPLWFAIFFWTQHEINIFKASLLPYVMSFVAVTFIVALLIAKFAPIGEGPMKLIYSGPVAFYGFIIAATWIDFIADHLVSLLQFFGILFHIPSSILGITILAWGNSMGDLSANMTMAKKGLANMAITACFAGPIFNILIGLASGFTALRHLQGKDEIEVELSPSIKIGFLFLILNSVFIIGTGIFLCNGVIPRTYGYFALVMYSIYIFVSIGVHFQGNE